MVSQHVHLQTLIIQSETLEFLQFYCFRKMIHPGGLSADLDLSLSPLLLPLNDTAPFLVKYKTMVLKKINCMFELHDISVY